MSLSVKEIREACPGITSDWIIDFHEAGRNADECSQMWMQELATQVAELTAENEQLKAENKRLQKEQQP